MAPCEFPQGFPQEMTIRSQYAARISSGIPGRRRTRFRVITPVSLPELCFFIR